MAAKPYHAGHDNLVRTAAKENAEVVVLVSSADRARPGEVAVSGDAMRRAWTELIEPVLPHNVTVEFVPVPVRAAYERIAQLDKAFPDTGTGAKIYADPTDGPTNFPEARLKKYFPNMAGAGAVEVRSIDRDETGGVSGTRMRAAIQQDDFDTFALGVPPAVDPRAYWEIVRTPV